MPTEPPKCRATAEYHEATNQKPHECTALIMYNSEEVQKTAMLELVGLKKAGNAFVPLLTQASGGSLALTVIGSPLTG